MRRATLYVTSKTDFIALLPVNRSGESLDWITLEAGAHRIFRLAIVAYE